MGKLETEVRKRERYGKIEKAVLATLVVGGMLSVAAVAPNVFSAIPRSRVQRLPNYRQGIEKAITRLARKGLIVFEDTSGGKRIRITEQGKQIVARISADSLRIKKPRRWDKKWRIVIFDIPETRSRTRKKLRMTLETIGFLKLQHSVWIYPFECEELIALLKVDFRIGKDVLYIIADCVEHDSPIKKHFNLS